MGRTATKTFSVNLEMGQDKPFYSQYSHLFPCHISSRQKAHRRENFWHVGKMHWAV